MLKPKGFLIETRVRYFRRFFYGKGYDFEINVFFISNGFLSFGDAFEDILRKVAWLFFSKKKK